MKRWIFLLLTLFLISGCGAETEPESPAVEEAPVFEPEAIPEPDPEPDPEPEPPPDPRAETVEALLAGMTLEEKVGQLFFVQCPALKAAEQIEAYHFGGCLLLTVDFKDAGGEWLSEEAFMEKVASYQAAAAIPLFIGVDEEGGTVTRASRNPNLFEEKCKSPQELFAENKWTAIGDDATYKNRDLLSYGINVNFAPVADVSTDPADFIYDRAFGQNAQATADYVQWVVEHAGLAAVRDISDGTLDGPLYKIGCVLKHFPGYGSNADTHTGIAIDERPYEQFVAEDFLPFQAGIRAGAGSVLFSHNIVTCMDPDLPASLSPEVHRVLREELGFQGVALTDDLSMDAVEAYAQDGSVAVLALLAGNDMVVTSDFATQIPRVLEAIEAGELTEEAVDEAVRRVLGWKYDLGLLEAGAEAEEKNVLEEGSQPAD